MIKKSLIAILACIMALSCSKYEYSDKLQNLGSRVEILEQMVLEANSQFEALSVIVIAVEQNGYITNMTTDANGNCHVTFNTGKTIVLRQGKDGKNGKNGRELDFLINIKQGEDGIYYWVINDEWLLDENGNRVPASAKDGKDGKDGKTLAEEGGVVPQMRINPETRHWEISTDSGKTWKDTGIVADGKKGEDGKNGKDGKDGKDGIDGADDIFIMVTTSPDGESITFTLSDGRTFTVPISK